MKLSRTVAYAVQATLQLAHNKSAAPIPCSQLASEGNMPERFLLQILRNLVTHGILRSTRGVDGGYALTRPPEEVSLLDVIEAIEGPLDSEDLVGDGLPVNSRSRLNDALRRVTASARRQLQAVKFSHLLVPSIQTAPSVACGEGGIAEGVLSPAPH
jgi:Rrf2 family protein